MKNFVKLIGVLVIVFTMLIVSSPVSSFPLNDDPPPTLPPPPPGK